MDPPRIQGTAFRTEAGSNPLMITMMAKQVEMVHVDPLRIQGTAFRTEAGKTALVTPMKKNRKK